jgi:general secretion pathway protein A
MYQNYFGFREPPFTLTPNPEFLFLSRCHQEAYAHLLYAIETRAGFIELSGEVGTGKTTLTRTLLRQLSPEKYRTALVFNPTLSPLGLLQVINREFGLDASGSEIRELHQALSEFLLKENGEGRTVVLVIDEAQNLSRDALEEVRLISNLETERDKLIQIVLVGQPELKALLAREDLRQLSQRITVRYHLKRIDEGDIHSYIRHRIRIAAEGREPVSFSKAAVKRISRYSKGLPRLINSVCDRSLLLAYTKDTREISGDMIDAATLDLTKVGKRSWPLVLSGILILAVLVSAVLLYLNFQAPAQLPAQEIPAVPATGEARLGGVKLLQEMLRSAGHYSGPSSNQFDAKTEEAVKRFQNSEGLKADGRPGAKTLARLYQKSGGTFMRYTAAKGSNPSGVAR